jgi:soluble lytic murein transglycosylase-like protein
MRGLLMGAMLLGTPARPKAHRAEAWLPAAEARVPLSALAAVPPSLAYEEIIDEAAVTHDVNPALIHAVIETESAFDSRAVSSAGAQGLMQLMPALQEELGVDDPFDPRQNIFAGTRHLKRLLDRFRGNIALALASYNAGLGNVARYRGVPPFNETRAYVRKITALLEAVSDGND